MGKFIKRYIAVSRKEYEEAHNILEQFYNRGDIDRITVEFRAKSDPVLIGLECSTDDLLAIQKEMRISGIVVV